MEDQSLLETPRRDRPKKKGRKKRKPKEIQ